MYFFKNMFDTLNLSNLVSVIGAGVSVASGTALIVKYVVPYMSLQAIELVSYTLGTAFISNRQLLKNIVEIPPTVSKLVAFQGQLMLPAIVSVSLTQRNLNFDIAYPFALSLFWGWQAISFQNVLLGFGSVMSLIYAGEAFYSPLPYCNYFNSNHTIVSVNHLTGLLILAYGYLNYIDMSQHPYVAPFRDGVYIGCSLVYYMSHLYLSDKHSTKTSIQYIVSNLYTLTAIISGIYGGKAHNLPFIASTAYTTLYMYSIQKYYEMVWFNGLFATFLLGVSMWSCPIVLHETFMENIKNMYYLK